MKNPLLLILLFLVFGKIQAQNRPFPQNTNFAYGFKPSTLNSQDVLDAYAAWKNSNVISCGNGKYRIRFNDNANETVSEGIAYGMIMSAYFADRPLFDGLWAYYKQWMNSQGLMNWYITGCDGPIKNAGGATDSELDASWALLVAYNQWGSTAYLNDGKTLINNIKTYETESNCNGKKVLKPGTWGGCGDGTACNRVLLVSYFAPAYYRLFAEATNDSFWTGLANDTYLSINQSANSTTGLVPHTQDASTGAAGGSCGTSEKEYDSDACRAPWRVSLDYYLNGTPAAKTWLTKISNWTNGIGYSNLKGQYKIDGTPTVTWNAVQMHVGAWVCADAVVDQTRVNNSATFFNNLGDESNYFNGALRILYMMQLTGNYWKPTLGTTAVTSVTVSPTTLSVAAGSTGTLTATVAPSNATNKAVTWSSSNTAVATVSSSGVVNGVAAGSANITVTTTDGGKTATSAVTVTAASSNPTTYMIYDDSFQNGWFNNTGWNNNANVNNTATVKVGSKSVKLNFTAAWGAWVIKNNTAKSTSGLTHFKAWVYGNGKAIQFVFKQGGTEKGRKTLTPVSGGWTDVAITLSDVGSPTSIDEIWIHDGSNSVTSDIFIDNIRLTNSATARISSAEPAILTQESAISVYPNPISAGNLVVETGSAQESTITLTNLLGKQVYDQQVAGSTHRINCDKLAKGLYVVRVRKAGSVQSIKVVIQ
jgi:endoglucanase